MKNAAVLTIPALKCDAEGCDYEETVEATSQNVNEFIGKPCPKCGANLLTEADAAALHMLFAAVATVNLAHGPAADDEPMENFPISMNGTGEIIYPAADVAAAERIKNDVQ